MFTKLKIKKSSELFREHTSPWRERQREREKDSDRERQKTKNIYHNIYPVFIMYHL